MGTVGTETAQRTCSTFTTRLRCFRRAWKNWGISSKRMSPGKYRREEERNSKVLPTNCSERWMTQFVKLLSWRLGEGSLRNGSPRVPKRPSGKSSREDEAQPVSVRTSAGILLLI